MISLYQIFKIIFGLIISVFILVIIIYFLSSYTQVQEDSQRALILKNFLKTAGDVYLTGNSLAFADFSKQKFILSFDIKEPEGVLSNVGKTPVFFPLFLKPGEELFLWKGDLDMGWWSFRFVEAMPRTRIIFTVLSPEWELVGKITSFLPDSDFFEPKITFGFCDGPSLQETLCGGEACEQQDFLFHISSPPPTMSKCSLPLPQDAILITISPSCSPTFSEGFCLTPPNADGIGNLYISGFSTPLLYKDPLDIVAAVIGGEKKDLFGNSGATLYEYKNNVFRKEIQLGAQIMSNRALIVGSNFPPESECQEHFVNFLNTMNGLQSTLEDEEYYTRFGTATSLVNQLTQAFADHQELVNRGCDYP